MKIKILNWLKNNLRTRQDWAAALTVLVPVLLVIGRASADYAISTAAVLFLFDSGVQRRWTWLKQPWIMAALILWGYSVIRAAFVADDGSSLFAAFGWLRYIVFAASAAEWTLADEKNRQRLLYSGIAAVLFLSIDGLIQYIFRQDIFGHGLFMNTRLTGPYQRPIFGMTVANLFAAPIFWLLNRRQTFKALFLAELCFVAVFLSGDRMGFIYASLIFLTWFFFAMRMGLHRTLITCVMACSIAAMLVFSPNLVARQFQSTATTIKTFNATPYRLVWKSGYDVGMASPFFGVGIRQFRIACRDERLGPMIDPVVKDTRCYTHPHNVYLEWFSEGGFVGLFGFIAFVATVGFGLLRRLLSQKSNLVLWGLSAMISIRLAPVFVATGFLNNWSAIPLWLAIGWAMSYRPMPQRID